MADKMQFEDAFFTGVLNSAPVAALTDSGGDRVLSSARAAAPVDSGDYRDGLTKKRVKLGDRTVTRIVGTDEKTMLIESKTGNLARAVRAAKT